MGTKVASWRAKISALSCFFQILWEKKTQGKALFCILCIRAHPRARYKCTTRAITVETSYPFTVKRINGPTNRILFVADWGVRGGESVWLSRQERRKTNERSWLTNQESFFNCKQRNEQIQRFTIKIKSTTFEAEADSLLLNLWRNFCTFIHVPIVRLIIVSSSNKMLYT